MVEYERPLGEDARKRHCHEIRKGKVISFVVQLEVFDGKKWREVVRYDSVHGYAHKDRYFSDGRKVKKILDLNFNEALTFADEDINDNWKSYKDIFIK